MPQPASRAIARVAGRTRGVDRPIGADPPRRWLAPAVLVFILLGCQAWAEAATGPAAAGDARLGLPPPPASDSTAASPRQRALREELGRRLFFDRRLSVNGTMSCAMCHVPEEAFASNASRTAVGLFGRSLARNAPSLLNVAWQRSLFHDGRERSLEQQAWLPLLHPDEMGNRSRREVLVAIGRDSRYREGFAAAFGRRAISRDTVAEALAAYERTLLAAGSRFDRWRFGGQTDALDADEQAGFALFSGRAGCVGCHRIETGQARFTDDGFHVTGAGSTTAPGLHVVPLAPGVEIRVRDADLAAFAEATPVDSGRFKVTGDPADRGAFKTPSLRNVARTAPYMHDGSLPTLEAVIAFYNGGLGAGFASAPLGLSAVEQRQLGAFLRSLDGAGLDNLAARARAGVPPRLGGH